MLLPSGFGPDSVFIQSWRLLLKAVIKNVLKRKNLLFHIDDFLSNRGKKVLLGKQEGEN
jgi:hypothetical protein